MVLIVVAISSVTLSSVVGVPLAPPEVEAWGRVGVMVATLGRDRGCYPSLLGCGDRPRFFVMLSF